MTHPLDDGLLERLLASAHAEEPGTGVEVFERRGVTLELSEDEEGTKSTESRERGFAVRLFRTGRVSFAAAGPDRAAGLVAEARSRLSRARSRRGSRLPPVPAEEAPSAAPLADPPAPDELAARALLTAFRQSLTGAGHGSVLVREATVTLGERRERVASTAGRDVSWSSRLATLVATVVGRSGNVRFQARVVGAAARPEELPVARLARHAVDRVLLPLHGKPFAGGRTDLLLDPHVGAHLVARLAPLFFGDEEEALLRSRTRDGKDALTGAPVTLIDDAAAPGGPIRAPRDGEGTPAGRTVLVERGVAVGRLTDTSAGSRLGLPASGNAIRLAWSEPPRIGVTNFFVDPSPGVSPLDLLADVSRGLYAAVLLERPEVDLASDRFRLAVAGFLLESGRAASRVSEATVSGRLSELLRGIAALGDDMKFVIGAGGGVGSPTLYVPRWRST